MMEPVKQRLKAWLKERVSQAGAKGVVVALSGGLDSSVAAALCKAVFPDHCIGVMMPCHSNPEDLAHATLLADALNIEVVTVDLSAVFDGLVGEVPQHVLGQAPGTGAQPSFAAANIKPRLRMTTLYYIAQARGFLVVGGENYVEWMTGYFTKYGDGGADLFPLGTLVKDEVRRVGELMGVPSAILHKPPSAGLWQGQTDEEEMGMSYDVLDAYFRGGDVSTAHQDRIDAMVNRSGHKREVPPAPARNFLFAE